MAPIRQELFKALEDIQKKLKNGQALSEEELEILFLSSLVEEEA